MAETVHLYGRVFVRGRIQAVTGLPSASTTRRSWAYQASPDVRLTQYQPAGAVLFYPHRYPELRRRATADEMKRLAHRAVREGLSARALEALIRGLGKKPAAAKGPPETAAIRDLATRLQRRLGARVRIAQKTPKSGRIEIDYTSLDELDGILGKIGV